MPVEASGAECKDICCRDTVVNLVFLFWFTEYITVDTSMLERERERERERQTDRQTDRQTETERKNKDRQTDRQK